MESRVMSLRAQHWKTIIITCNSSGMKKADWMRRHGVSEKSFYRWQHKLRDEIPDEAESKYPVMPDYAPASMEQKTGAVPELIDVTSMIVQKAENMVPPAYHTLQKQITPEIMIQAGPYNLYIGSSVTEATLATVLKVIGHA